MADEQLTKQVEEYAKVAKENPNVNVGLLMMNALQNERQNSVSTKAKRWVYLISLSVPLVGFLIALKYFFSDEDDAQNVAWTCVILTVICTLMFWLGGKLLVSGSGTSVDQISKLKPSDIIQAGQ